MYPPRFNGSLNTTISDTVLISAKVMGQVLFISAYFQYSQRKWVVCNFTGNSTIDTSSVAEWWPLPAVDSGIPMTAPVIDKTIGMIRDSKHTKSLRPAVYSSQAESWFPINNTHYVIPPVVPYEWFPLPTVGTGVLTISGEQQEEV